MVAEICRKWKRERELEENPSRLEPLATTLVWEISGNPVLIIEKGNLGRVKKINGED